MLRRLIEDCDLLAQLSPGGEQRPHDQADFGSAFEQRLDPPIKSEPPTGAGQQAAGLQHAAYRAASKMIDRHGASALREAARVVGTMLERRDVDRLLVWARIHHAIILLESPPSSALH